jgi:hypothetical protein
VRSCLECALTAPRIGVTLLAAEALATSGCGGAKHPVGGAEDAGIDPSLVGDYSLLRRPLEASDRLPPVVVADQERLSPAVGRQARLGLLPALARRVTIPGTRLEAWLEPGRHGFCLSFAEVVPAGAARTGGFGDGCGPPPTGLTASVGGGAFLAAGPPLVPGALGSPALVTGIVPDRVGAVELVGRGGATTRLRLAGGIYATRFVAGDRLDAVIGATPPGDRRAVRRWHPRRHRRRLTDDVPQ